MTTNTHIAAHPKQLCMMAAAILGQPPGTMDNRHPYWPEAVKQAERAYAALQSAQALEAVPALDAQGEEWKDHQTAQLVNDLRDTAVQFHGAQQLRERIARLVHPLAARLSAAPLPHAVGKPLNDEQIEDVYRDVWSTVVHAKRLSAFARAIERAHGIVTKESDT